MEEDFKVYVIYKDDVQYDYTGMKGCYRKVGTAKALITQKAKHEAMYTYENKTHKDWYELTNKEKEQLIDEQKKRWKIKVFTESYVLE